MKCFNLFLYFILIIIILSCSDTPTENNSVTLSGKVTLVNRTEHGGVKISLYTPVELDTTVSGINDLYTDVGFKISQETEFDHRHQKSKYSTSSSVDGSWKIEGVIPSIYNIVAEKDSFGWQYLFDQDVSDNIDFIMQKAIIKKGVISENLVLKTNQFLIIEENAALMQTVSMTFEGNNTILLGDNVEFVVRGDLQKDSGNFVKISSLDFNNKGKYVNLEKEGSVSFSNLIFSDLKTGIVVNKAVNSNILLSNCLFNNNENGIYNKFGKFEISKSIFHNNSIYDIEDQSECVFSNNIVYKSAGLYYNNNNGVITNNVFVENKIAITPYKGGIVVSQNNFKNNELSIAVNSSECEISYNNFYKGEVDIELNRNYVQAPILDYSKPVIKYNNFFDSSIAVTVWGNNPIYGGGEFSLGVGIEEDLEVPNCYWGATNTFSIDQRILDIKDNTQFRDYEHYILYEPFESQSILQAGVN